MNQTASLAEMAAFLDDYLAVGEVPDYGNALNGIQVENSGTVHRIMAAVDAGKPSLEAAAAAGPGTLLLVHHGIFWDGNLPVTGRRYRRIRTMLQHDLALYAAHLPLDVHDEVGNNVLLAKRLGLTVEGRFGAFQGMPLGVHGALAIERDSLVALLNTELHTEATVLAGGPSACRHVGIVTGGAGDMIAEALAAGCDTFVTGEGAHHTYFDAHELGINVIYAGHYATEQLGVQALAALAAERFTLPWTFFDHPTGL
jgi:dinuclear metal center YbgI/SA1388 family protein